MAQNTHAKGLKSERLQIRATQHQAHLIKAGAARRRISLADYILDSTCARAEMDLADQNQFVLPEGQWNDLLKALDAPPKVPSGLKRLFERGSVAERR